MSTSNIVLVTDWITKTGGGEKVVEQFHKIYPDAPIYTSYCSKSWNKKLDNVVQTGYLQHWPFSKMRRFLPVLRQHWFKKLDLSDFDTIISITGNGEAKFVQKRHSGQVHISYCHTPVHFYWAQYEEYLENPSMRPKWLARLGLRTLVKPLRKKDFEAAQKVDLFIANSSAIKKDIQTFYKRDSTVIHPPIDTGQFIQLSTRGSKSIIPDQPECIWWGRVVPAKRLDIAIEACNKLDWPLTIIGDGPALADLKKIAGPNIKFTGYIDDKSRNEYIAKSDLFIFPSREDFGVSPVEALASGRPVVAYQAGGALDYVEQGKNGVFFEEQSSESLIKALRNLKKSNFNIDSNYISNNSQNFSEESFASKITDFISASKPNQPTQQ